MADIVMEVLRAVVLVPVLWIVLRGRYAKDIVGVDGWKQLTAGFILIFFGSLIDITDNFERLNQFIIIGDTPWQAFLEKVVGYLFGFMLLAIGILRWLPKIIEYNEAQKRISSRQRKK